MLDPAEQDLKVPAWLNDLTLYHNRGDTTFVGENSLYGDFFGLDDLFTENPRVVQGMIDIYETWIADFGVDGFRIDTMKHVDDAFWQRFGPEVLAFARAHGKREFFMFGEVFDTTKSFTSHFTTTDRMQAVLDFPFQAAAQGFAASSAPTDDLRAFFAGDDWYTDADSNVYQLPTFLGNHDMGRIGRFVEVANPDAADAELLARDRLAHELMYLSRGNPVIYYGDEQGFVGDGGDQDARQDMFPSQVATYNDDDLIGTDATTAVSNFDPTHPLYRAIGKLARLTQQHEALRDGAQIHRLVVDRRRRLRVLPHRPSRPARVRRRAQQQRAGADGDDPDVLREARLPADLRRGPPLAREQPLGRPVASPCSRSRRSSTSSGARSRAARRRRASAWPSRRRARSRTPASRSARPSTARRSTRSRSSPRSGMAPGRASAPTTTRRTASSTTSRASRPARRSSTRRSSSTTRTTRARPTAARPRCRRRRSRSRRRAEGSKVRDTVELRAVADPERATHVVRFERMLDGGEWTLVGSDDSSPAYTATDDISVLDLAPGTPIHYRAVLTEPDGTTSTSAVRTVTAAGPPLEVAVVHYFRPAGDYTGWGLHLWGDAVDPAVLAQVAWDRPWPLTRIDGAWARYEIPLQDDTKAVNFIMHLPSGDSVPDTREPGGDRSFVPLDHPEIWLKQGDPTVYFSQPPVP